MSLSDHYKDETADELYNAAQCGYFSAMPDGTIVKINDTLLSWLGYERNMLVSRVQWRDLLTKGGQIYYETHYAPLLRMYGVVKEINFEFLTSAGTTLPILVNTLLVYDDAGVPVLSRSLVLDITERKQYERELLLAKNRAEELTVQLQEANRQMNEILSIAVHDLKNPLHTLRMAHQMLTAENANSASTEYRLLLLKRNIESIDTMSNLITRLLQVNALEHQSIQVNLQMCDVGELMTALLRAYQLQAVKKNLSLHLSLGETGDKTGNELFGDKDCCWSIDEEIVVQIADNLLSNAIKYSPKGKNITIRLYPKDTILRLEVHDEGPGISNEDIKKLFGKFSRLSAQPTGGENSTGLGLSIVKKLADAIGAKVWCESELGRGATFIVELPRGNM